MHTIPRSIFPGTLQWLFWGRELGGGMEGQRKDGRMRATLLETHEPNFQMKLHKLFQTLAQDDSLIKFWHQQGQPGQYREA